MNVKERSHRTPERVDWANVELPETWADRMTRHPLSALINMLRHPFRKRRKIVLPEHLPGRDRIPKYALLEFHHLPNGNYSDRVSRGYITGFERSMLGAMPWLRGRIAEDLADHDVVLDIGSGGGKTVNHLRSKGHSEVWGLEPSPYLLRHACRDYPEDRFVQGVMEDIPFGSEYFDAVSVSFVLHEMPPHYIRKGLAEIWRVLKPGGRLLVGEPSPAHYRSGLLEAIQRWGWRGLYFRTLSRKLHEPYIRAWHGMDFAAALEAQGFKVLTVDEGMPVKYWVIEKTDAAENPAPSPP